MSELTPSQALFILLAVIGGIHFWSRWTRDRELETPNFRREMQRELEILKQQCDRVEAGVTRHDTMLIERTRVDHDLADKIQGLPIALRAYFITKEEFSFAITDSQKDRQRLWEKSAEFGNELKDVWKQLHGHDKA